MALVSGSLAVGAAVAASAAAIGYAADETGDAISQSMRWGIAGVLTWYGGRYILRKAKR